MRNGRWMTAKDVLRVNAFKWPNKIGIKDLYKSYTFKQWDDRSARLANALADMGMKKGDRFAVLAYNCVTGRNKARTPHNHKPDLIILKLKSVSALLQL